MPHPPHPIEQRIALADTAINQEDFDSLVEMYTHDAVLVIKPGVNATGRPQIRQAFDKIAAYFEHSLQVRQAGMQILETGDTALVLARTIISATNLPETQPHACYVFTRSANGDWLCAIDNSYGHELLPVTQT